MALDVVSTVWWKHQILWKFITYIDKREIPVQINFNHVWACLIVKSSLDYTGQKLFFYLQPKWSPILARNDFLNTFLKLFSFHNTLCRSLSFTVESIIYTELLYGIIFKQLVPIKWLHWSTKKKTPEQQLPVLIL